MPKATRISVKGTRGDDTIAVVSNGILVNGVLKPYSADALAAGVTINGDAGNDHVTGGAGADQLTGFSGADTLIGGGGLDSLSGGEGNDTLIDAVDGAIFDGGMGVDFVDLSAETRNIGVDLQGTGSIFVDIALYRDPFTVSGPLPAAITGRLISIENLRTGPGDDMLIGNASANILEGGSGADNLAGRAGNDSLYGGDGDDHLIGEEGSDLLYGGTGADIFYATAGSGHDTVMDYGAGDRIYFFNSLRPSQWILSNDGISLVGIYDNGASSITILNVTDISQVIISGQIHGTAGNDTLTSTGDYDQMFGLEGNDTLLGNGGDDHLLGGDGQDVLDGGSGNDILDGGSGADSMWGGLGEDIYHVDDSGDMIGEYADSGTDRVFSSVTFALSGNVENLTLTGTGAIRADGNSLDNLIIGNSAANIINGSGGADTMLGGGGDDIYYVHDAGDIVGENAGEGTDIVASIVSFVLSDHVEHLYLFGDAAIDATGNDLANAVYGNGGANQINGRGGNDILWGGAGADTFLFDTALDAGSNVDSILDFTAADDTMALDLSIFSALTTGALDASAFRAGSAAQDADDRIIYDSATGNIYYDADGNGAGEAVLFAQLAPGTSLSAGDLLVVP